MVRIPLPARAPPYTTVIEPFAAISTTGGGTDRDDLAPLPASMLPSSDQIRILPPPRVKMREALTLTSPCA